jgi:BMFP domain-containing protein YqiC
MTRSFNTRSLSYTIACQILCFWWSLTGALNTQDIVQRGMTEFQDILLAHPLWATRTQAAQERALDALEHYIMTRLHKRIFAPDIKARQHDAALRMRIAKLQVRLLTIQPVFNIRIEYYV